MSAKFKMEYKLVLLLSTIFSVCNSATLTCSGVDENPTTTAATTVTETEPTTTTETTTANDFQVVGDMRIPDEFVSRSGVLGNRFRWPLGEVIYDIDRRFNDDHISVIQRAIREIESKTCITFRRRRSADTDYVFINRGDTTNFGCWAHVGRLGGRQMLNLEVPGNSRIRGCVTLGTVAHELIHTIGYLHEQSRPDRDDFIRINWANIDPEHRVEFRKCPSERCSTFDVPYDYSSIMHYKEFDFGTNKRIPTMYARESRATLGGDVVTRLDARKINNMYRGICESEK